MTWLKERKERKAQIRRKAEYIVRELQELGLGYSIMVVPDNDRDIVVYVFEPGEARQEYRWRIFFDSQAVKMAAKIIRSKGIKAHYFNEVNRNGKRVEFLGVN